MPAHKWTFKSRFHANAHGWKGIALATKRLMEAVSEIKKVAKFDPVTAADKAAGLCSGGKGVAGRIQPFP